VQKLGIFSLFLLAQVTGKPATHKYTFSKNENEFNMLARNLYLVYYLNVSDVSLPSLQNQPLSP